MIKEGRVQVGELARRHRTGDEGHLTGDKVWLDGRLKSYPRD